MATVAGLTIDDFERLPEVLARNHELIDGELVEVSGNKPPHNILRDLIVRVLSSVVEQRRLGLVISAQEFDFDGNVHGPDVSFLSEAKRAMLNMNLRVQRCVPDLAIEIASANDTFQMLARKAQRYRQCGTREVWVFCLETRQAFLFSDHRRAILEDNDEFNPEAIPGFGMRIGDLLDRCR